MSPRIIFNYFICLFAIILMTENTSAQNWQLVWQDEFNYTGLPDANKWSYDVGAGGWGNNEAQYYSNARSENSRVENGNLIIEARRDWAGAEYSSARLVSRNKGDWTYGRIEIRAKIPVGQGLWPAIWMLPTDQAYGGWPRSGEIDIMESFALGGLKYDKVEANIHTQAYNHTIGTNKGAGITGLSNIEQNYHTYRVTWTANKMVFDVDGQEYFTFNNEGTWQTWPYDKRFHLILNIAIGGTLGTWIEPSIFPKRMEVDYVRVYQDSPGPVPTTGLVTSYNDCNYAGFSGGLNIGNYTTSQLAAIGIQDNSISSFRVSEGYKVIAYDGDNFTGNTITYTADNSCVGAVWNDKISSVKIVPNGVINMDGTYYLQNRNSGLYMDVAGGEVATHDGANIAQWSLTSTNNQKFEFIPVGDGAYTIKAVHSGKVVDVAGGEVATQDGVNIHQWTNINSANQHFIVVPVTGGYYKLIAKHSGKVVEVAGASTAVGANIQQWKNNNQTCGQWTFKPVNLAYNAGDGIRADYFNGQNFETWRTTKKENNINFAWGNGSPDASVNADNFSARWTGKIQPRYTGTYTFHINSDNGRRLWVNNQLIINNWENNWGTEYTGTIALEAGKKYDIVFEYFEATGGAASKLEWSSASQAKEVVPQGQLYANVAPTVSITSPANNTNYVATAAFTINATAADSDGSIGKVEFYNGTTKLGEDATSPYSYNWTNVAAGTYTITARAIDNQGVFTTSTAITVKVNANQTPTVSITSPGNNATFTTPASITINAMAADADGTISKVEFYNGTTKLGEDATSPYSYAWTNVAAGTYTLTAKAIDDKNGSTTSTAITVVVSNPNQAPTVSITGPANNTTYIAPATFAITATAADTDGSISKVEFYNGATLLGTSTASPYSYNWANVAAGTYTITAKAYDNLGLSTTSTAITVKVNANQTPTVSITSPANNATFTSPASISINATAADTDGSISKVEFYNGTTKLGEDATSPYSYAWTNIAAGTYTLTAKAIDDKNGSATSSEVTVVISNPNQNPTVNITSPANNTAFTSPASIIINATASDADGSISKVEFYNGTTLLGTDNTSPYTYNWTGVAAGTYTITAKATDDKNGTATSAAVTVIVNNPNGAPAVSIISPANNVAYIAPATFEITATASDADGSVSKVEFYNGTTLLGTDNASPYNFNWSNVATGTYTITAKAYDNQGLSTTSTAITVIVNANQTPIVTMTAVSNSPNTVSISVTATDGDGSVTKVEYYDGTTKIGESTTAPYTFTWTNAPAGIHSITAIVTDDKGGATTSSPVVITVEGQNENPTVTITSPVTNSIFDSPAEITISANAADNDGSISKVEFYNGTTKLGEATTSPYSFTWSSVASGVYTIKVIAHDNKGAQAQDEISIEVKDKVTSVWGQTNANQLMVYPNPTKDIVSFNSEVREVNIYSLKGVFLMNVKLEAGNRLDLSSLSSGMYLIELLGDKPGVFVKVTKE